MEKILKDVHKVFELIQPLIEKLLTTEFAEKEEYVKNLRTASSVFRDISSLCKDFESTETDLETTRPQPKASYYI